MCRLVDNVALLTITLKFWC